MGGNEHSFAMEIIIKDPTKSTANTQTHQNTQHWPLVGTNRDKSKLYHTQAKGEGMPTATLLTQSNTVQGLSCALEDAEQHA